MKIQYLNWDTEFFGIKTGKIEINDEKDFNPIEFKELAIVEKYELIYVFKYRTMLTLETINKANIELVDIMLTMSKRFEKKGYINNQYKFRQELSIREKEDCYHIAEQTSIVSRFYNERKVGPHKTKELYRKWIDNALNKSFSDGLFLDKNSNSVAGIHLIKTDRINKIGYFTLTGVNPNYKRMGIGSKLWVQSFAYWANESEIEMIKSPFSFQNSESFNFHLKMGFTKVEETKFIYHFRNNL